MSLWSRLKKPRAARAAGDIIPDDNTDDAPRGDEAHDSAPARYLNAAAESVFIFDDEHLIYTAYDRTARRLGTHLTPLLESCHDLKSLAAHLADFARATGHHAPDSAWIESTAAQLAELVAAGLLLSEHEIIERCRKAEEPRAHLAAHAHAHVNFASPPPITTVGIVTCERPALLRRCLTSFIENALTHSRAIEFVVTTDDAPDSAAQDATCEVLHQLKKQYEVAMRFAGANEKTRLAERLAQIGAASPATLRFALFDDENFGASIGKNRNALLLDTAGEMFFGADDDAVCRLAVAPVAADEDYDFLLADAAPTGAEMEMWFFPQRAVILDQVEFIEDDVLAGHERLLGKTLRSCVADFGDLNLVNLKQLTAHDLRALLDGRDRVHVTFNGIVGDSGTSAPVLYRPLSPATRRRATFSEDVYDSARTSRETLRLATDFRINRQTWTISTALAYDNRSLLPPFFPVRRGTDGLFADTLRHCFEHSYIGDIPRAVMHLPEPARTYSSTKAHNLTRQIALCELLSALIRSHSCNPMLADSARRLTALGTHLIEIGSLPPDDFDEFARLHVWQFQAQRIAELEVELALFPDPPAFWANDLRRYLARQREPLTDSDYILPADMMNRRDKDDARAATRRLVVNYGHLLCAWTGITEAAKELRGRGERLTIEI